MIALDCSDARLQVESIHRPLNPSPAVKAADSGSPLHSALCTGDSFRLAGHLHLPLKLTRRTTRRPGVPTVLPPTAGTIKRDRAR
jgi:hypothetical protein